ncbi:MAG: hypothetical protein C4342_03745 [Armatimonadota bacterium]
MGLFENPRFNDSLDTLEFRAYKARSFENGARSRSVIAMCGYGPRASSSQDFQLSTGRIPPIANCLRLDFRKPPRTDSADGGNAVRLGDRFRSDFLNRRLRLRRL